MDENLSTRIKAAELPTGLKIAVLQLVEAAGEFIPRLPARGKRRLSFMLERLVEEVLDPAQDPHWWGLGLDLLGKAAQEQGVEVVLQAVQEAKQRLSAYLGPYSEVTLREITEETVNGICLLSDTLVEPQSGFVAPNVYSLAQAHFNPHAWFRAIYAGKAPVGFMMIVDDEQKPEYFLWRFMVAAPYQGRGYARQALDRLVEYVRSRPGAQELLVSCGLGAGSPEGFYLRQGFVPTGEMLGDEIVLRLAL